MKLGMVLHHKSYQSSGDRTVIRIYRLDFCNLSYLKLRGGRDSVPRETELLEGLWSKGSKLGDRFVFLLILFLNRLKSYLCINVVFEQSISRKGE